MKINSSVLTQAMLLIAAALFTVSKAAYAALAPGALLTGPPQQSTVVSYPNILIGIDNTVQSASEVAWTPDAANGTYPLMPSGVALSDAYKYTLYTELNSAGTLQNKYFDDNRLVPFVLSSAAPYTVRMSPSLSFGRTGTSTVYTHTNVMIAKARSHYGNPMYYNPAMTYSPWNNLSSNTYKYGLSSNSPFPATAAPLDVSVSDTATVNLLQDYSYDISAAGVPAASGASNADWKAHVQLSTGLPFQGTVVAPNYAADTFRLATYYVYKPQASGGGLTPYIQKNPITNPMQDSTFAGFAGDLARYKKVVINSATAAYDWYPTRTDCITQTNACSYDEELENFKNWFIYYRTKLNAQKAVLSWALSRLSSEYRIGLFRGDGKKATDPNVLDVRPFNAAHRAQVMDRIFETSYGTNPNHLAMSLIGVGNYFKNSGTTNPWQDITGTGANSCRPSAAILLTDGSATTPTLTGYDPRYITGTSVNSSATALNPGRKIDAGGSGAGPTTSIGGFLADIWSASNRAQFSGVASLSGIAHAHYWYDLMPSMPNTRLAGTNMPGTTEVGNAGILHPIAGDPAAHQRLRLHVLSFGMPGANHPNYPKLGISDGSGNASYATGSPGPLTPTWGLFNYHASQKELKNIDDLQQAAINGHGAFIEWQSSSRQMKLDPRMQLLTQMASMLPRSTGAAAGLKWDYDNWYRSGFAGDVLQGAQLLGQSSVVFQSNGVESSYAEGAVMEESTPFGVPQVASYEPSFENRSGNGSLRALNASGYINAIVLNTYNPTGATPLWYQFNAGRGLLEFASATPNVPDGRKIFAPTMSSVSGALGPVIPFIPPYTEITGNTILPSTTPAPGAALTPFMMSAFFNNDSNLVWWLRGSPNRENPEMLQYDSMHKRPFRNRGFDLDKNKTTKMGAIINSHPVVVRMQDYGYGADFVTGPAYRAFLKVKKDARPRVAVGSNDGMFRVFDGNADSYTIQTGNSFSGVGVPTNPEDFAYIPAGVMGNMKQQAHPNYMDHLKGIGVSDPDLGFRYTVDGPASTGDVQFTTNGAWKSIVTGSLGNGGKGLFAIDVTATDLASNTNPAPMTAANVLWDKTVEGQWSAADWADVGAIRNRTGILKLRNGSFGVLVGNGANSDSGKSVLFILDPQTGSVIKKITASNAGGGLMGVSFLFNYKREVIAAYGGDLKGNLWKFDLSDTNPSSWGLGNGGGALMTARSSANRVQPITARPALFDHPDGKGTLVMVGTGSNFRYQDEGLAAQHSVYGILDKSTVAATPNLTVSAARSDLVAQTLSDLPGTTIAGGGDARTLTANAIDYDVSKGWVLDLPMFNTITNTYEAVTGDPRIVGERLLVATGTPMPAHGGMASDTCDTTDILQGSVTSINPITGGLVPWTVYDTNGDKLVNASDNNLAAGYVSKSGKRAAGVMPTISRSGSGYTLTKEEDVMSAPRKNPVKSWRELQPR